VACPVCGADDCMPLHRTVPKDIVRCRNCRLVYVNPRRSDASIRDFFEREYITTKAQVEYQFGTARARTLRREAGLVKELVSPGRGLAGNARGNPKILDIGCAGGEFLSHFDAANWDRFGVEPSAAAADEASARGIRIYPGPFQEACINEGPFDVVAYLDAIYFSTTPKQDLIRIRQLLKPDGLLIVEIPGHLYRLMRNIGPVSLLMHRRWCQLSSNSPHLIHFSDSVFRRLLRSAGFSVVRVALEGSPESRGMAFGIFNACYLALSVMIASCTFGALNPAPKMVYMCRPFGSGASA
jgi:SAM-dependent methyltransferase